MQIKVKDWNIEEMTGYKPISTFYSDFSLAEPFGVDAIKETYERAFNEWKTNYKYLTELVMSLNWKIAEHYETDKEKALVYDELWRKADEYAVNNLTGEELKYFYNTTD